MVFWNKKESGQSGSGIDAQGLGEAVSEGVGQSVAAEGVPGPTVVRGESPERETKAVGSRYSNESALAQSAGTTSSGDPDEIIQERFGSKLRAALGSGTIIQGKLSFDTPIRIDGKLTGEVYSSKALIVGPTAVVDTTMDVQSLVSFGRVKGTIVASERIELYPGAVLEGTIRTPALVIHEGARFDGDCTMVVESPARTTGQGVGAISVEPPASAKSGKSGGSRPDSGSRNPTVGTPAERRVQDSDSVPAA